MSFSCEGNGLIRGVGLRGRHLLMHGACSDVQLGFLCLFKAWGQPVDGYKKAAGCFARGLKFCVLWMSAILPTTGPSKDKEKAKAERIGFNEGSGGRRETHNRSFPDYVERTVTPIKNDCQEFCRGKSALFFIFFPEPFTKAEKFPSLRLFG